MNFKFKLVVWILSILFCVYWFFQVSFQVLNTGGIMIIGYLVISTILLIYLIPWIFKYWIIIKTTLTKIKQL